MSKSKKFVVPDHPWNSDDNTAEIITAVSKGEGVRKILETGTCLGKTSLALAEAGFEVVTVDPEETILPEVRNHPNIEFVKGTVKDIQPGGFDAAFIDGDHSYQGVSTDFKACEQLNIPLIFIHDCFGIASVFNFIMEQDSNPHYRCMLVKTRHPAGHMNGIAIFKRK